MSLPSPLDSVPVAAVAVLLEAFVTVLSSSVLHLPTEVLVSVAGKWMALVALQ